MRGLTLAGLLVALLSADVASAHNLGWAVGHRGEILHSTTSGATWHAQQSGTSETLRDVDFTRWMTGIAVGDAGAVLHTYDGGETWFAGTSNTTEDLRAVAFRDARKAIAVGFGGVILSTNEGGSWWSAETGGAAHNLFGVDFVDAERGWAVGSQGAILHTTNGGSYWSAQTSGTSVVLLDVDFVDANTGWVVGNLGTILHTSDGGATWSPQSSGTGMPVNGVDFVDADHGWAVAGDDEFVLRTVDGGATWIEYPRPYAGIAEARDVAFASRSIGTVVGTGIAFPPGTSSNNPPESILHDRSGGRSWDEHPLPAAADLESVVFVPHPDHIPNADLCRSQCELALATCEEIPRSEFRDYDEELPYFIVPGPNETCSGGSPFEVQIIEGSCANGQVIFLKKNGWLVGGTHYYDATTRKFTGLTTSTDISAYPCESSGYWPAPITCPNATVTAVHCGTQYTVGDPVYQPTEGTIPVEGAFVYPEDIPALPAAAIGLVAAGVATLARRRLRGRPRGTS